jgi:RNA polymerase sigma-70 factor (ECF subfamily)
MISMSQAPKLDAQATEQVWRALHADLRRYLLRRVGSEAAADDLLQEVFLRIHSRIGSLADTDRLHAWVYRIAGNLVIDHYRAAAKRETPAALAETAGAATPTSAAAADEDVNGEVALWLANMVEHLPETYREAVRLSELQQVPQAEIARRLGLSLSGAKSRVQRGRELLKASLDRCCRFELDSRGNLIGYTQQQSCEGCCDDAGCESP